MDLAFWHIPTDYTSGKLQKRILYMCAGNHHWSCNDFEIVQWQLWWKQTWLHPMCPLISATRSYCPPVSPHANANCDVLPSGQGQREVEELPSKGMSWQKFLAKIRWWSVLQMWNRLTHGKRIWVVAFHTWKDGPSQKGQNLKGRCSSEKMTHGRWTISHLRNAGNDASSERLVFGERCENKRLRTTSGLHCSLFFMLHSASPSTSTSGRKLHWRHKYRYPILKQGVHHVHDVNGCPDTRQN